MGDIKIVFVNIDDIKEYEQDARKNDRTIGVLAKHIKEVGFNVPLVLDRDNYIIKGHARKKAAEQLGIQMLPVIYSDNSDELNELDRILDNKIQELSEWDYQGLKYELEGLSDYLEYIGIDFGISLDMPEFKDNLIDKERVDRARKELFATPKKDAREYVVYHCEECGGAVKYVRH